MYYFKLKFQIIRVLPERHPSRPYTAELERRFRDLEGVFVQSHPPKVRRRSRICIMAIFLQFPSDCKDQRIFSRRQMSHSFYLSSLGMNDWIQIEFVKGELTGPDHSVRCWRRMLCSMNSQFESLTSVLNHVCSVAASQTLLGPVCKVQAWTTASSMYIYIQLSYQASPPQVTVVTGKAFVFTYVQFIFFV